MSRMSLVAILAAGVASGPALGAETRQVPDFAPNPGDLLMFQYVPEGLPRGSPLVVALHGCTQSAQEFDDESGWTELAERHRFAVVLPEQQKTNNESYCFNWFLDEDNRRDGGEAASIKAMVDRMVADHGVDPRQVFVTGLSAGGGMAVVMLATYPEVFAGGSAIAGVPYGCANRELFPGQKKTFLMTPGTSEAGWAVYACGLMSWLPFDQQPGTWADLIGEAGAPPPRAWPKVSLWQGGDDQTVHPMNLQELVDQWTEVHGIDGVPDDEEITAAYRRRVFENEAGEVRVETFELLELGHAVPVDPGSGDTQCGKAVSPYFVDRDVCAAFHIAQFWGLTEGH